MGLLKQLEQEVTEFVLIGKSSDKGNRIALHPVRNEKIAEEVPFLKENAKKIFAHFSDYKFEQKHFEGFIPKDIILAKDTITNGLELAWIFPKGTKKLYYSEDCKSDGLITEDYFLPNLFFHYSNNKLSVFSIADKDIKNISTETELFHAPFYNVFNNGSICMGNVNVSKCENFKTFDKCKNYLEVNFFKSFFTHSNNDNMKEYILSLKNETSFNPNNLKKTNRTINKIIK